MKHALILLGMGMTFWLGGYITLIVAMARPQLMFPHMLMMLWAGLAIVFMLAAFVVGGIDMAKRFRS